jgi:hypothetical protein
MSTKRDIQGMRWLASDWDYRMRPPVEHDGALTLTEILGTVQEAVGVGQPHCAIDELPMSIRQLFQETDFHIVGNRVFKKKDPVAQALDGDAGYDIADADEETIQDMMEQWSDRSDVVDWLREHGHEVEIHRDPEDALNHADYGLVDMAGEGREEVLIDAMENPEHEPDNSVFELLDTESLNSPFCGLGYRPPRDSYGFRSVERRSLWAEKKAGRDVRFGDMLAEVKDLDRETNINKFLENIREDYYRDKALRQQWNRTAFEMDRSIYMDSLRRQGLDEETIRRKLWAAFDRVACTTPAVIVDGKVVRQRYRQKDSFWSKARSEALQDLILTASQWNRIYDTARRRREWCRTEGSQSTLLAMKKLIDKQETLHQLDKLRPYLVEKNECLSYKDRGTMWRLYTIKFKSLLTQRSQESSAAQRAHLDSHEHGRSAQPVQLHCGRLT